MVEPRDAYAEPVAAKPRLFYGWVISGVGTVTLFFSGLTNQGFSSYLGPVGQEFGWSRSLLAGPRSVTQLENALLGPLDGYIVDKFGGRAIVIFGMALLGAGLILFGLIGSLWQYFAANILIGLGTSFAGGFPMYVTLNNWFRRKRTTAISITQVGISLSGLIAVPVLVWGQQHYGWRETALASGIIAWVVGIPIAMLIKRSPESVGQLPDGDPPGGASAAPCAEKSKDRHPPAQGIDFTLREALRTRAFYLVALAHGLNLMVVTAVVVHQFLHLEQGVGLARGTAAGALALVAAFNIAGWATDIPSA